MTIILKNFKSFLQIWCFSTQIVTFFNMYSFQTRFLFNYLISFLAKSIIFEIMTGSAYKTSTGLCILALSLLCIFGSQGVVAAPQPVPPGMLYREENYAADLPQVKFHSADKLFYIINWLAWISLEPINRLNQERIKARIPRRVVYNHNSWLEWKIFHLKK